MLNNILLTLLNCSVFKHYCRNNASPKAKKTTIINSKYSLR